MLPQHVFIFLLENQLRHCALWLVNQKESAKAAEPGKAAAATGDAQPVPEYMADGRNLCKPLLMNANLIMTLKERAGMHQALAARLQNAIIGRAEALDRRFRDYHKNMQVLMGVRKRGTDLTAVADHAKHAREEARRTGSVKAKFWGSFFDQEVVVIHLRSSATVQT